MQYFRPLFCCNAKREPCQKQLIGAVSKGEIPELRLANQQFGTNQLCSSVKSKWLSQVA